MNTVKKIFKNKKIKIFICTVLCLCILGAVAVVGINAYMISFAKDYIIDAESLSGYDFDCIMVLGAGLWDGEPSPMLKERLDFGLEAYSTGCSTKFLMSGDHGTEDYDEVNAMKDYIVANSVDPDDIFLDHAGFSTYESMYRARDVFKAEKMLIVTQKYHLYRAVYNARKLGIDAYGFDREELQYPIYNDLRESAARVKDFFYCIAKPEPTYLGEEIPVKTASATLTDG
ncbi:MAG: YdcF family protein [Oscillospiraceae bacterium]|nr:YdcF family protein [Oscillospiraceae bacterium]